MNPVYFLFSIYLFTTKAQRTKRFSFQLCAQSISYSPFPFSPQRHKEHKDFCLNYESGLFPILHLPFHHKGTKNKKIFISTLRSVYFLFPISFLTTKAQRTQRFLFQL